MGEAWVHDAPLGDAAGVTLRGLLDMACAAELQAALEAAAAGGAGVFVIDLTDVAFMDSSGINALARTRALLDSAGRELVLVCPPGPVLRVLVLVGLVDLVATFPTRGEAARHLVSAR